MKILERVIGNTLVLIEFSIFIVIIILSIFWIVYPSGSFEPAIVILGVILGAIDVYRRIKEKNIDKTIKILPSNILSQIIPGASLELIKEKFGASEIIYTETPAYFGDNFIQSKSYYYSFDNANMEVDSHDGEVVETITLHNFSEDAFSLDYINDLGILTAQDILDQQGTLGKVACYTSMRYAYIAIECQSDRTGGYFYYTFVCFDWTFPDLYQATYNNEKLYNSKGKEILLSEIIFESVSVSSLENHGHPACRMMLQ